MKRIQADYTAIHKIMQLCGMPNAISRLMDKYLDTIFKPIAAKASSKPASVDLLIPMPGPRRVSGKKDLRLRCEVSISFIRITDSTPDYAKEFETY